MPMRARFLNCHTAVYALAISLPLGAAQPTCWGPTADAASELQSSTAVSEQRSGPQAWFAKGQMALQNGDLDAAEAAFRQVLSVDPRAGSAYANLGVIAMRRKDWDRAIALLRKAERLEPKKGGNPLNLGLGDDRRGHYAAAIEPFTSLLRGPPDPQHAR